MTLRMRKALARILNPLSPGFGGCYRCNRNWSICSHHTTKYNETSGCFPLCEECWEELSPRRRLGYYHKLWMRWKYDGQTYEAYQNGVITLRAFLSSIRATDKAWPQIKKAVLKGL